MAKSTNTGGWEAAYQKRHSGEIEAAACVVENLSLFKDNNTRRILDLGCGDGRHLVFLAQQGFEMSGLDSAPTAIRLSQEWLHREGLAADLKCADMSHIPWPDKYFDAIICIKVINHHRYSTINDTLHEAYRVLRDGGLFLFTSGRNPPPDDWKNGKFKEIERHTFMPLEGHEKGIPHLLLDEDELRERMRRFDILKPIDESSSRSGFVVLGKKV